MAKIRALGAIATAFTQMQNRLYTPPPNEIAGVTDSAWPTPLNPVNPIAPAGSSPIAWNFWQGQNLTYTPRPDAEYTAAQLKRLAVYPLARILIEQVKDSVCSKPWRIQLKSKPGETNTDRLAREQKDDRISQLMQFFEYPDGETNWSTWLRPWLDDVLTIDAGCILMRRKFKGDIAELRIVPGESITRYIDENGWTPKAPSPAYAQLWEGMPRVNLTTDQLVYRPQNIVPRQTASSHLYGMSPTEQLAPEIETGIQRLAYVLAYYTEGSTPGVIQVVPKDVTPDLLSKSMQALNSQLAGDLAKRRQIRMLPGFTDDGTDKIIELKEPILADAFDDLMIRKLAYGYGTSATRLLRMLNRAVAESDQGSSEDEGEMPWFAYLKSTIDYIVQVKMGHPDLEWIPDLNRELDPKTQSEIDDRDIKGGLKTRNECRKARGLDPMPIPEMDMPTVTLATGIVPIEGSVDRLDEDRTSKNTAQEEAAKQPRVAPGTPESKPDDEEGDNESKPGEGGKAKKKLHLLL